MTTPDITPDECRTALERVAESVGLLHHGDLSDLSDGIDAWEELIAHHERVVLLLLEATQERGLDG